jgi:hypothetical protein
MATNFQCFTESRRATVDVFLKAAGYLDCAIRHVLPQIPPELRFCTLWAAFLVVLHFHSNFKTSAETFPSIYGLQEATSSRPR